MVGVEGRCGVVLGRRRPARVEPRRGARARCMVRRTGGVRGDEASAANKPTEASARGPSYHPAASSEGGVDATTNSPHVEAGVDGQVRLVPGIPSYLAEALEQARRRVQQVVGQNSGAVHLRSRRFLQAHAQGRRNPQRWRQRRGEGSSTRFQIGIRSYAETVTGIDYPIDHGEKEDSVQGEKGGKAKRTTLLSGLKCGGTRRWTASSQLLGFGDGHRYPAAEIRRDV